jgi:hypothetical protein
MYVSRGAPRSALLAAALALSSACGRERAPRADSASAARVATGVSADAGGTTRKPLCPATGHWAACSVRERIDRAGLAPFDSVITGLPALGPAPLTLRVNKAGLAIYLFADSSARARAATQLDTIRFVDSSAPLTIRSEATVIQNDNLLALLFSKNDHQRERVADALMAGPPQL